MINVLRMQLYRLKKSKLFWAMFIVCAILPVLSALLIEGVYAILQKSLEGISDELALSFTADGGATTLAALGDYVNFASDPALLSLICSSIFLSGEFSGGAIRNMIIANKSRTQIFLSFLTVALIIGFSCFGVSYASALVSYGVGMGFEGVTVNQAINGCLTSLFLGLLTIALVQACVVMFLFCTRKTGATVAFPLLILIIAPSIVTTIVNLVVTVKIGIGQNVSLTALNWVPLYNVSLFDATAIDGALVGQIALYNAPLSALLAFFGWFALNKVDLK